MERLLVAAGALVILGAAMAVLVKTALWGNHVAQKIMNFLDSWNGEDARPGYPRRPGVPERLAIIESRLYRVEQEFKPNDGHSLRDAVDRVETAIKP